MPLNSLLAWQTERLARLNALDSHSLALEASTVVDPRLVDKHLRGFVVSLSAHFQGFCGDWHTECAQAIAREVSGPMSRENVINQVGQRKARRLR